MTDKNHTKSIIIIILFLFVFVFPLVMVVRGIYLITQRTETLYNSCVETTLWTTSTKGNSMKRIYDCGSTNPNKAQ